MERDTAADNRARFPESTKIIDEFKRVFGAVKVRYIEEGGATVGRQGSPGVPLSVIPEEKKGKR